MDRIRVMHIIDTLDAGGAERLAVNLVNFLPRNRYLPYLCTTRRDGPLAGLVAEDVKRLRLERRWRFDIGAVRRLVAFNRAHNIRILHAHGTSLFIGKLASFFTPYPALIWHSHAGWFPVEEPPVSLYRLAVRGSSGVVTTSEPLAEWSRRRLHVSADRVWYVPNFVCYDNQHDDLPILPGTPGNRIVCVANLRPQKDPITLLKAMALVVRQIPKAYLLLVGDSAEPAYSDLIRKEILQQELDQNISLLGRRLDVAAILKACDVGVLSSTAETCPLTLLEYGMAGLPAVATNVGQCAEVLDEGRAGIVVPTGSPDQLAQALLSLLRSPQRRSTLGQRLRRRVQERYSPAPVMEQVCQVYETVLSRQSQL